jgi:hypothetical protein
MDKINKLISHNPKYAKLKKPLQAAEVCKVARDLAMSRYDIVSFNAGLLTIGVTSSAQATEIQMQSGSIIRELNQKLGEELVKRVRYKII